MSPLNNQFWGWKWFTDFHLQNWLGLIGISLSQSIKNVHGMKLVWRGLLADIMPALPCIWNGGHQCKCPYSGSHVLILLRILNYIKVFLGSWLVSLFSVVFWITFPVLMVFTEESQLLIDVHSIPPSVSALLEWRLMCEDCLMHLVIPNGCHTVP